MEKMEITKAKQILEVEIAEKLMQFEAEYQQQIQDMTVTTDRIQFVGGSNALIVNVKLVLTE